MNRFKFWKWVIAIISSSLWLGTKIALAEIVNPILPTPMQKLSGSEFFNKMFSVLIQLSFAIGSVVFFYMLIFGAIRWITSSGDKGKLEAAQKQITSALVGLVILLLIFAIINLIETLFGISILTIKLPTLE